MIELSFAVRSNIDPATADILLVDYVAAEMHTDSTLEMV